MLTHPCRLMLTRGSTRADTQPWTCQLTAPGRMIAQVTGGQYLHILNIKSRTLFQSGSKIVIEMCFEPRHPITEGGCKTRLKSRMHGLIPMLLIIGIARPKPAQACPYRSRRRQRTCIYAMAHLLYIRSLAHLLNIRSLAYLLYIRSLAHLLATLVSVLVSRVTATLEAVPMPGPSSAHTLHMQEARHPPVAPSTTRKY